MSDFWQYAAIPGWMEPQEMEWLADIGERSSRIAEVGSWQGRTTKPIAQNTKGLVYAVDTFLGSAEHQEEIAQHPKDWVIGEFMKNMNGLVKALAISEYFCQERLDELTWLAEQAEKCQNVAEIGSWLGSSTRALADNTQGLVFAVDTFKGSPELMERINAHEPDWLYNTFKQNTSDASNVITCRMTSLEAAHMFRDVTFDLVFIDANHEYEHVCDDILAWRPLVRTGGILAGHDREWDGVKKAVNELIPFPKVAVGAIWYTVC
jgi:predicted O-methyltransferase YrrM